MSNRYESSAAPPRLCRYCGKPEHGSAACHTVSDTFHYGTPTGAPAAPAPAQGELTCLVTNDAVNDAFERAVARLWPDESFAVGEDGYYISDEVQAAWWGWSSAVLDIAARHNPSPIAAPPQPSPAVGQEPPDQKEKT